MSNDELVALIGRLGDGLMSKRDAEQRLGGR